MCCHLFLVFARYCLQWSKLPTTSKKCPCKGKVHIYLYVMENETWKLIYSHVFHETLTLTSSTGFQDAGSTASINAF